MIRLTNEVKKLTTDLEASLCRAERAEEKVNNSQETIVNDMHSLRASAEVLKQLKYLVVSNKEGLRLLQSHLPHLVPRQSKDCEDDDF